MGSAIADIQSGYVQTALQQEIQNFQQRLHTFTNDVIRSAASAQIFGGLCQRLDQAVLGAGSIFVFVAQVDVGACGAVSKCSVIA